MEEPYEAWDPSWQLEITVNSSSAWFPLTNSQCCNVKWSVPQTREQHRCSLTPQRLHLKAPILQPSILCRANPPLFTLSCSTMLISTRWHLPPSLLSSFSHDLSYFLLMFPGQLHRYLSRSFWRNMGEKMCEDEFCIHISDNISYL